MIAILSISGAIILVVLARISVDGWWRRCREWHEAPFRRDMMRCWTDGRWQYRPMTDDEAAEAFSSDAW
jgi:hypothetical protein